MSKSSEAEMPFPPQAAGTRSPPAHAPRGTLRRLHYASARHPEWWMVLAAAAAWAFLAVAPHANPGDGGTRGQTAALAAMVVAMMLPLTVVRVRQLTRSRTRSPHRAAIAFVAGYLGVWMLAMAAIGAAWKVGVSIGGWTAAVGIVIAAAVLWEVAPAKWRASVRSDNGGAQHHAHTGPVDAGSGWLGVTAGGGCVASCWALMAACVAFAHSLPLMAALFAIQLHGRYRRPTSPALTALAVLCVCLASLALGVGGHHHHLGM